MLKYEYNDVHMVYAMVVALVKNEWTRNEIGHFQTKRMKRMDEDTTLPQPYKHPFGYEIEHFSEVIINK